MKPVLIRTEGVTRCFPSGREMIYALKDVNISIQSGTFTILRGRSGSGKTTLINLIGALDKPTGGKIYFNGDEITQMPESKRDAIRRKEMGFVFQSIALISMMSAYENVEFALRVAGYNTSERSKRAEECFAFVGLSKRMHHRPANCPVVNSKGGNSESHCPPPKVVFADEPTAELDTHTGLQVVKVFKNLVEKEGLTVVMTTHDPSMVEIADHVYTLEDGEIVDEQ